VKILIVAKNWLGDMLFQVPALEAVKAAWPQAEIVCVAPPRCRAMVAAHPAVSRFIAFDERREQKGLAAKIRWVLSLRGEKWDKAFLFHRSRTRAFLTLLAGARERVGYGKGRDWFLTQSIANPDQPLHEVDYFLNLLKQAGIPVPERARYRFYFTPRDQDEAHEILSRHGLRPSGFVCFHMGANWEPKRWPLGHFARTAEMIHEKWQVPVAVTGSREDGQLVEKMRQRVSRGSVIPLTGQTPLGVLGAVFAKSAAVVSADSGPMHIASGSGANVVALFGPTDPRRTGPRGIGDSVVLQYIPPGYTTPWIGEKLPDEEWMSGIRPERVIQTLEEKKWIRPSQAVFS